MNSIGESLRDYWLARGLPMRPGASEEQLTAFESRHGVRLPPDLRAYYAVVDGLDEGQYDDSFFSFWPIDRVEAGNTLYLDRFMEDQSSFFVFADHSISLPDFAIRLTRDATFDNPVVGICSDCRKYSTFPVADSFTEFAQRYLAGPLARVALSAGLPLLRDSQVSKTAILPPSDRSHPLWDKDVDW